MTHEEAYNYCASKQFHIMFVPGDGPHILTPQFRAYKNKLTFCELVDKVKTRVEKEERVAKELEKLLKRSPTYSEISSPEDGGNGGQGLIDKLIEDKIKRKTQGGVVDDSFKCPECKVVWSYYCKTCDGPSGYYNRLNKTIDAKYGFTK